MGCQEVAHQAPSIGPQASPVRTRQLPALVALCLVGVGSDSAQPQEVRGDHDPCP